MDIYPEDAPHTLSVDTIEGFLKVHEDDVELPHPLNALLYDVSQGKYMICTFAYRSKYCLFLSQFLIDCFRFSSDI